MKQDIKTNHHLEDENLSRVGQIITKIPKK